MTNFTRCLFLTILGLLVGLDPAQAASSTPNLQKLKAELDSPQFTVVHTESDFQIRLYRKTVWASAVVDDFSFVAATTKGFHRLFQYIEGANLNWSHIPMTTPVLTGLNPGLGPFCASAFVVRLYLPTAYQAEPPTPLPELDLRFERWEEQCVAVRTFSGYAKDNNVAKEAGLLAESLERSPWANATDNASNESGKDYYAIAQYDSPLKILGRSNEVWVALSESYLHSGCQPLPKLAALASIPL